VQCLCRQLGFPREKSQKHVLKQALPGAKPGQKTSMRRPWRVRGYVLCGQENKAGAMVLAKTVTGQVLPPRPV
jgi:hypothetical protein